MKKQLTFQLSGQAEATRYRIVEDGSDDALLSASWGETNNLFFETKKSAIQLFGLETHSEAKQYCATGMSKYVISKLNRSRNDFELVTDNAKYIAHNYGKESSICNSEGKLLAYMKVVTNYEYLVLVEEEFLLPVFMLLTYYNITFSPSGYDQYVTPHTDSVLKDKALVPRSKDIRNFLYSK